MVNAPEEDRTLDFGQFPGRWEITRSTADTGSELLEMHFDIQSASGDSPPQHVHPHAEERYHVLSGVLEVNVDGEWQEVHAGETHAVSPGTPHTFRNKVPVELINIHEPALEFERFFRRFHRLVRDHGVTLPPRSFKSFIMLAMLFSEHEQEVVSVMPPQVVMRLLAGLGRLLGYRLPE